MDNPFTMESWEQMNWLMNGKEEFGRYLTNLNNIVLNLSALWGRLDQEKDVTELDISILLKDIISGSWKPDRVSTFPFIAKKIRAEQSEVLFYFLSD